MFVTIKHKTFTQCCANVGPASTTLGQHWYSIGWMSRVFWAAWPSGCADGFLAQLEESKVFISGYLWLVSSGRVWEMPAWSTENTGPGDQSLTNLIDFCYVCNHILAVQTPLSKLRPETEPPESRKTKETLLKLPPIAALKAGCCITCVFWRQKLKISCI